MKKPLLAVAVSTGSLLFLFLGIDQANSRNGSSNAQNTMEAAHLSVTTNEEKIPQSSIKIGNRSVHSKKPVSIHRESGFWSDKKGVDFHQAEQYEIAAKVIGNYFRFGFIESHELEKLRANLYEVAGPATVTTVKELNEISASAEMSRNVAKKAVGKIDFLTYLADSGFELAREGIKHLATRKIEWLSDGKLKDPIQANVTFECFDIFSKHQPEDALSHLQKVDRGYAQGYVLRYMYGRRLAGKSDQEILTELEQKFGPELKNLKSKTI